MYKSVKIKNVRLSFHKFNRKAKGVSKVYLSGFRYWKADDSFNYSVVVGVFRIIFSLSRKQLATCG